MSFKVSKFLLLVIATSFLLLFWLFMSNEKTINDPTARALYLDPNQPISVRVSDLLSFMTREEKIGQMMLIEKNNLESIDDISIYGFGGLLSGAGSKPSDNTPSGWEGMIRNYQNEARLTRLGIPLLYGADAIHGHAHVPGATVFPHAIGLGASNNHLLVEKVANATAMELAATGVNWSYSPNLDLPQDIRWGRVYEAFSDDPALVSKLGSAYLKGLQASEVTATGSQIFVLATPKHYLGLGGMKWQSSLNPNFIIDQGVTETDVNVLRTQYLPPFLAAVEGGALSIMVGLNTWGNDRMVRQKDLLTNLLKEEVGFKGFLVSDWYGVHEGEWNKFFASVRAINSGVDMVMFPFDYKGFLNHIIWANRLGLVSDERINDAVSRVLYAKFALGLFDNKETIPLTVVGSLEHRLLARQAVSESLVLLKNEDDILPIKSSVTHIRVAGSAADNVGRQMGAWTVEWQGIDGYSPTPATSILSGIRAMAKDSKKIEFDVRGEFSSSSIKAQLGIAIVGERPYAEGWGDVTYPILSESDRQAIKNLDETCDKVLVVVVSGRPLFISNELSMIDSLVAAWLPGSEGGGVADVLFGKRSFTGKLPLPWPNHSEQLPISASGKTADGTNVLFPRGYGLYYK